MRDAASVRGIIGGTAFTQPQGTLSYSTLTSWGQQLAYAFTEKMEVTLRLLPPLWPTSPFFVTRSEGMRKL